VQELVASTYDQLLATRAAIRSFRDEVRANQVALDGVEQEALVGSRTVLDVLDAEQALFQSRVDLVRARRDEVITSYQLKAAVGQLTVADLGLGVEVYDPKAYYERNRTRLFGLDGGSHRGRGGGRGLGRRGRRGGRLGCAAAPAAAATAAPGGAPARPVPTGAARTTTPPRATAPASPAGAADAARGATAPTR
jgi:hypothetical protein